MSQNPPQPTLVKKMLNEAVSNALPQNYDAPRSSVITVGAYDLQLSCKSTYRKIVHLYFTFPLFTLPYFLTPLDSCTK